MSVDKSCHFTLRHLISVSASILFNYCCFLSLFIGVNVCITFFELALCVHILYTLVSLCTLHLFICLSLSLHVFISSCVPTLFSYWCQFHLHIGVLLPFNLHTDVSVYITFIYLMSLCPFLLRITLSVYISFAHWCLRIYSIYSLVSLDPLCYYYY